MMTIPITIQQCKSMLFKVGIKHGVAPKLISERLLSNDDKEDMLQGFITYELLDEFVKVWKEQGMFNYADGSMKLYERS